MLAVLVSCSLFCSEALGEGAHAQDAARRPPVVLGHGVGLFEIGDLIAHDDFRELDKWVVQVEEKSGAAPARVEVEDGALDCFLPSRGATIWFKEKFKTRIIITYDVLCPTTDPSVKNLMPRDINNFWMATDPLELNESLFDSKNYTGSFKTYDKMHGYYASTGGGRNTTTRMRRYPRDVDGQPVPHIALKERDGKPDFLITPDKVMKVQLVAFDDVIQYIVDGKLVYQMKHGDEIQVEQLNEGGARVSRAADYGADQFPFYKDGYFGFRMVGTHHIYSNFKVHALDPTEER